MTSNRKPSQEEKRSPIGFSFFVVANSAFVCWEDNRLVTSGLFSEVIAQWRPAQVVAAVGVYLRPEMEGKHLTLRLSKLCGDRRRVREGCFFDFSRPEIPLPSGNRFRVLLHEGIDLVTPSTGVYVFDLIDRFGLFGNKQAILASHYFEAYVPREVEERYHIEDWEPLLRKQRER